MIFSALIVCVVSLLDEPGNSPEGNAGAQATALLPHDDFSSPGRYEVTSTQAFEGLSVALHTSYQASQSALGETQAVRRPNCTLATVDHNIPYARLVASDVYSYRARQHGVPQELYIHRGIHR